jgi:hypothetical protein
MKPLNDAAHRGAAQPDFYWVRSFCFPFLADNFAPRYAALRSHKEHY